MALCRHAHLLTVILPNADRAIVAPEKVRDYLLASDHPLGRGKAKFFAQLGFAESNWHALQAALLDLARSGDAEIGPRNRFGQKYLVRGALSGPQGRPMRVLSIWIILNGEDTPRLLTAYPGS